MLKEIFPNRVYINLQDPCEAEHLSIASRQPLLHIPSIIRPLTRQCCGIANNRQLINIAEVGQIITFLLDILL